MFEMTQIDKRVQKKLFDRISQLNRTNLDSLAPLKEGGDIQLQELTKTCWVRVTSAVPDKVVTGKSSANLLKLTNTFNGKTYDFDKEGGTLRPHAGVTGITTSFQNHSIQTIELSWKIYNMDDFKKYESAFLKHGRAILVEFGWGSYKPLGEIRVNDVDTMFDYFKGLEEKILDSEGNYYAAVGVVSAFTWNVVEGGGFECTTTLTSLGNTLFKSPLDKYTDQNFPDPGSHLGEKYKNMEVSPDRREAELANAYNRANLTFNAFMAQFNEVCGALGGDVTIRDNLEKYGNLDGEKPKITTEQYLKENPLDQSVSERLETSQGYYRQEPSEYVLKTIEKYKLEIQGHKDQIKEGDTRTFFGGSREKKIKKLEKEIIRLGGVL